MTDPHVVIAARAALPPTTGNPNTRFGIPLRYIQSRAPRVQQIHQPFLLNPTTITTSVPGRKRKFRSLALVLKATIHGCRDSPPPPC